MSDRQRLFLVLKQAYQKATSQNSFFELLRQDNIEIYERNGKPAGIKFKRKWRFKTLGYYKEVLQELDKNLAKKSRLASLERIRSHQAERFKDKEQGRER